MKKGGLIRGKFNQEKFKEDFIKRILSTKPPGYLMENPFCPGEWIMKKPIEEK